MTIQHKDLPDAQRHEPKGISTASSGQIYVADGSGSGLWTTPSVLSPCYSNIIITQSAASTLALSAASDSTLSTASDYTKITSGWAQRLILGDSHISFSTDKLLINTSGYYQVALTLSFKSVAFSGGTNSLAIRVSTNNATSGLTDVFSTTTVANTGSRCGFGLTILRQMTAGESLSVWVASTAASTVVVSHASLVCNKLLT